ncbi:MAG: peptidylprolyl isomerase [Motilibacteraceae bacterium]
MASKERERQLARAKFERQQARRAERARRRRRNNIVAAVGAMVVVALVGAVVYALNRGSDTSTVPAAAGSPSPSATAPSCTFTPSGTPAKGGSALGRPADGPAGSEPGYSATLVTNVGTIAFTALTDKAPCATRSFAYLAGKKYFDGTPCHRLTTTGIYVLQCGDPSGTGSGGPGYSFGDENLPKASGGTAVYKAGTVAMANSGPSTNGSQFFLVYKDSPLPPNYTVFGTITQGLDVVSKVAAAGVAGGGGDGAPQDKVTIKTVTISQ